MILFLPPGAIIALNAAEWIICEHCRQERAEQVKVTAAVTSFSHSGFDKNDASDATKQIFHHYLTCSLTSLRGLFVVKLSDLSGCEKR